jgi:uncharacterized membrane protein
MTLYTLIKTLHILFAITAVGMNISYGIWTARAARDSEHLGFALKTIKFVDDRIANPSYGMLLVTGLLMVWVGGLNFKTFWIGGAIVLFVVAVVIGAGFYTPALRKQIEALAAGGAESAEYKAMEARSRMFGILNMLPVLVIIFLMVNKPTLG